ncbi:hypothetical protein [Hansschlegelia plantiphila]|nr:hypothetical protein [Hansschlegelia plantiphila]
MANPAITTGLVAIGMGLLFGALRATLRQVGQPHQAAQSERRLLTDLARDSVLCGGIVLAVIAAGESLAAFVLAH